MPWLSANRTLRTGFGAGQTARRNRIDVQLFDLIEGLAGTTCLLNRPRGDGRRAQRRAAASDNAFAARQGLGRL
jgi:hypothetical protein